MRLSTRLTAVVFAAATLVAACGKSGTAPTTTAAAAAAATTTTKAATTTGAATTTAAGKKYAATLTGANEAPAAGATGGTGKAEVTLDSAKGEVCYDLSVSGITGATASHIHDGASGVAGPVVVPFQAPAAGTAKGCTPADKALVDKIIANPSGYYVNVHTTDFPGGAIRGQLAAG